MNERPYDAMVAGHLCLDIIPRFPDSGASTFSEIIRPGKLVVMDKATLATGGPVSNTGIAMSRQGPKIMFAARIGDDEFGRLTLGLLELSGNAEGIHVSGGSVSSYTIVLAPPRIDRVFLHNPGTNNEFSSADLKPQLIAQCKLFHLGYPPLMRRLYEQNGAELIKIFKLAKDVGATTSLDMSLPDPDSESGQVNWLALLTDLLPYVDIYLPSAEETLFMLERDTFLTMKNQHGGGDLIDILSVDDYTRLADKLLALGAGMTALKSGHRGFYFKTSDKDRFARFGAAKPKRQDNWSNRELWCPAFAAPDLASATGSGDSSIAGFLSAFLRGSDLEVCLKRANMLGWQNVQVLDAVSGIKSWDETSAMVMQDKTTNDLHIDNSAWSWNETFQMAAGPNDPLTD
jgi:sugar/nucleoside kinase (ribokinase family)